MKKLLALFIAAAVVGTTVGLAAAQAPKEEKKAPAKATQKQMMARNATGKIKSASADTVVVAGKDKGKDAEWTFGIDAKTKIKRGGKDVTAADLKAGDSVAVRYTENDGKAMAQTINVRAAGAAKKAATKPAEKK